MGYASNGELYTFKGGVNSVDHYGPPFLGEYPIGYKGPLDTQTECSIYFLLYFKNPAEPGHLNGISNVL